MHSDTPRSFGLLLGNSGPGVGLGQVSAREMHGGPKAGRCCMPWQCVAVLMGCDNVWQQSVIGAFAVQVEDMEAALDAELEALELELAITRCEDTHVCCTPSQHIPLS